MINSRDHVNIGRNNSLKVFQGLTEAPHNLKPMSPTECQVGGLRGGTLEFGLYNNDWSKRLIKQ